MGEAEGRAVPASISQLEEGRSLRSSGGWSEALPEEPPARLGAARWKPGHLQPRRELLPHTYLEGGKGVEETLLV